jgi:hypothetical protein
MYLDRGNEEYRYTEEMSSSDTRIICRARLTKLAITALRMKMGLSDF